MLVAPLLGIPILVSFSLLKALYVEWSTLTYCSSSTNRGSNSIFQKKKLHPCYVNIIRVFLEEKFSRCWIEKRGWKAWPPMDVYLRRHVKQSAYVERIQNIEHVRQVVQEAVVSVIPYVM